MIYLLAIAAAIITGILVKGRISNLLNLKFEKTWLILAAFVILSAAQITGSKYGFAQRYSFWINLITFCMLLIGLWYNRRYAGMLFIGLGCLLNAAAILVNGGKMPVSMEMIEKAGLSHMISELSFRHMIFEEWNQVRLPLLSDIIHIPGFLGYWVGVASIGDLIITLGLFCVVLEAVAGREILPVRQFLKIG